MARLKHRAVPLGIPLTAPKRTCRNSASRAGFVESAVRKAYAPRRQCGRRQVLRHAAVYVGVAGMVFMTVEHEPGRPSYPRSAAFRRLDPLQVQIGQIEGAVIEDPGMGLTRLDRRKMAYRVPDRRERLLCARSVRRFGKRDRSQAARDENQPLAVLGHTVVAGVYDLVAMPVAQFRQKF